MYCRCLPSKGNAYKLIYLPSIFLRVESYEYKENIMKENYFEIYILLNKSPLNLYTQKIYSFKTSVVVLN